MTQSEIESAKLAEKRKDRFQRERSEDRAAKVNAFGSTIKAVGSALGKFNDPIWYKKLMGLSVTSTNLPDFNPIGIEDVAVVRPSNTVTGPVLGVPSVVRINYAPVLGLYPIEASGATVQNAQVVYSPLNKAINRIATQLEMRNSRIASYSRDTIGRYIFIVTNVAVELCRIKLALDVYAKAEASKPRIAMQIIRALGFKYTDFRKNVSAYKFAYASLINDFNEGLPIPLDLTYLKRQLYLATHIVKEGKLQYDSYIVFNKCIQFNFPDTNFISHLGYSDQWAQDHADYYIADQLPNDGFVFSHTSEFDSLVDNLRRTINSLVNGATWKPLIRDLRGGTQSKGWLKLNPDVTKPDVVFVDIDEVREQIHNLVTIPSYSFLDDGDPITCYGLLVRSFSVGGDAKEAVLQNEDFGMERPTGNHFTAGSVLYLAGSAGVAAGIQNEYQSFMANRGYGANSTSILSIKSDVMTSDQALVATRLKAMFHGDTWVITGTVGSPKEIIVEGSGSITQFTTGGNYVCSLKPFISGTELVCGIQVINVIDPELDPVVNRFVTNIGMVAAGYGSIFANNGDYSLHSTDYYSVYNSNGIQTPEDVYFGSSTLVTVDWFPITTWYFLNSAGAFNFTYGELDHYIHLERASLAKLHYQCIESEFTLADSEFLKPLA